MNQIQLPSYNWESIYDQLHQQGFAIVKQVLNPTQCQELIADYEQDRYYRKTIHMERYRFGSGEYKYFTYPLPSLLQTLRTNIYSYLAPVANLWMKALQIPITYPDTHEELLKLCQQQGQVKPTVLILKYKEGGFNTLHQDLYGEIYFPLQIVFMLNQPGTDYTGGEFVLTEQIPRAQSKANVLQPERGDMLIFATNFRPAKGTKGYYRVAMKHGVSPLHSGDRHSLGIIFHDAL
ncbi:prolyl 4-hydroxylase subunit alpha [Chitinophaga silvatica]|uniref:Prolyl 4-hydroxylase subunit alpha n=1 Tax=Chitinophaga silvatica TaxID=2282649 RepID=A0A3E1Y6X9_9BACT|nr:2OG-Fe(II) oxygenase [Chitinophaga silvatica]RFS20689.1 prolyl 4-hydroxylase subunit alpha [Chitinophaga silvatica]